MTHRVYSYIIALIGVMFFISCSNVDNPAANDDGQAQKALLVILDGWGIGDKSEGDVIYHTPTPYIDYLTANYPHTELQASGEYVGLPDGQMGNSETGHLNIGAGRVVYQDLVKINHACADNSIVENPEVKSAFGRMNPKSSVHSMLWTVTNPTRMSAPRARQQQPRQRAGCLSIGMKMKKSGWSTKAANQ